MAAVNRPMLPPNPDEPPRWEERHQWIAHQLVRQVAAARPEPDSFVPHTGMPLGQDIQLTPGAYTYALIAPGEWPTDSETALEAAGEELTSRSRRTEEAANESNRLADAVFDDSYTAGEGAEAASAHYKKQYAALLRLAAAQGFVGSGYTTLGDNVRTIKRLMREEHDTAHAEIERMLRFQAMSGGPVGVVAIVAQHRPLISGLAANLHEIVAEHTSALTTKFPETPPLDSDPRKGKGIGDDLSTDASSGKKGDLNPPSQGAKDGVSTGGKPGTGGHGGQGATTGGVPNANGIGDAPSSGGIVAPPARPGGGRPSMPPVPSSPGASPLSGAASGGMGGPLSGLLGGGGPGGMANNVGNPVSSVQGQTARAMQASLGGEFGRGFAAGANAVGAVPPPVQQPVPQSPASPLAAPMGGSASPAAAPATTSAPIAPAPAPAAAGGVPAAAPATGGPGGAQMTSYGSVLPPAAAGAGPVAGGAPAGLSGGSVPPGPVAGGGPGATSLVPVGRGGCAQERVPRDISMSDLEVARGVVADLAAASSVVYPGLDWAVGVARGSQGIPRYWIASNEGLGCYIPAGVYVSRSMPVAGDLDDGHWAGWFDPAETVLRAIEAHGSTVSAIATSFPSRSMLIDEDRPLLKDVAFGVPRVGGPDDAEASRLLQSRSHRLETVAPALFHELSTADPGAVAAYARQVTQQAAFIIGPELSAVAQAVARAVTSGRRPRENEFSALRQEYTSAHLMAGSQRPGLSGIHEPHQLLAYQQDFALCRRLETLVCWENDEPADVVYAAWQAGVRVPLDLLEQV